MDMKKILVGITALLIAISIFGDHTPSKNTSKNPTVDSHKTTTSKVLNLGLTVDKFKSVYNQNVLERNIPQLLLNNIEFIRGKKYDTFGQQYIQSFYLLGKIDKKTNLIKSVHITKKFVLNGNSRKSEAQAAAIAFLLIVKTLSPSLTSTERAAILDSFSSSSKKYTSVVKGDIRYSQALLENGKVLMLSAEAKDVK